MKPTIRTAIAAAAIAALTACGGKKADAPAPFDNDPVATRTRRYLTQKPWRETMLEYQQQDGLWAAKPLPAGASSQTLTFGTNGSYTVKNGDGTVAASGGYDIIGDNTQLALDKSVTWDMPVLSDTQMQLVLTGTVPYTDPQTGASYTYYGERLTFAH